MAQRLEISASEQARQELVRVRYQREEVERQEIITGQRKCVINLQNSLPQDFETNDLAGLQIRQGSVIAGNKGNSQLYGSGCNCGGINPPAVGYRALAAEGGGRFLQLDLSLQLVS